MKKKAKADQLKLETKTDLTDFSDPEDIECLSEDGLWALACHVSATCQAGWVFVDLYRDPKKPGIVRLMYSKQGEA